MKIMEILHEDAENWTSLRQHRASKVQNGFKSLSQLKSFVRNEFPVQLKNLAGFLKSWESLAKEYKYPHKYSQAAIILTSKLLDKLSNSGLISTNAIAEDDIAQENLKDVQEQFKDFAYYYASLGQDFDQVGVDTLRDFSNRLGDLLKNAAKEIEIYDTGQ